MSLQTVQQHLRLILLFSIQFALRSRAETDTVKISTLRCYPYYNSFKFMKVLLAVGCCW